MNHLRFVFFPGLRIAVLVWVLWAVITPANAGQSVVAPRLVRVVAVTHERLVAPELRYDTVLRSADRALLAFTEGGRLQARPAALGMAVVGGQLLARLDRRPYQNALQAVQAAMAEIKIRLRQLELDWQRGKRLYQAGALTKVEFEDLELGRQALQAQKKAVASRLQEARRKLEETELRAPFAGTISELFVEAGEVVAAGKPIVALDGENLFEAEIQVPETMVVALRPGDEVNVDLPNLAIAGRRGLITSVGRGNYRLGGLFPVVVSLPSAPGLFPGVQAEVVIKSPAKTRISLPLAAIVNPTGKAARVFVVKNGRARAVQVHTGDLYGAKVAVSGALQAGDQVIVAGHSNLLDGDLVEVGQ